jgi:hypothetical protein
MIIIAIDPGVAGGIAGYDSNSNNPVFSFGFSTMTESDIVAEIKSIREREPQCVAVIEELQRFSPAPAAKMAVYAASYGVLKGALLALGFRIHTVRSQRWQSDLALGKKGEMKSPEWKRKLKERAQQLFPGHKMTLQSADALLILEWARIKMKTGMEMNEGV